jgi:hypothetical protein
MAVDKKISQLASGAPAQAGDEYVVARSGANYKLTLTNIAASMPATTITSGNLTFSSTAQRITGDMSNATVASRLAFQGSTTNATTSVGVLPNGTSVNSSLNLFNASDPTNAGFAGILVGSTEAQFRSAITGTGTYLPMTFYTGGSERVRIDTSGNVGIGTASPAASFGKSLHLYNDANTGTVASNTYLAVESANRNAVLELSGSSTATNQITFSDTLGTSVAAIASSTADSNLFFRTGGITERMRIDSSGNVGIGGATTASVKVHVLGTLPLSSNNSFGVAQDVTFPNGAIGQTQVFRSVPSTAAASFTVPNLAHYYAAQGTFGAGSTVTNQFGYYADANMTGATNNFGFYSGIASGSNRWNFYAAGTANNYFAGRVGIGVTPTYALHVESAATEAGRSFRLAYDSTYYLDIIQKGAGGAFFRSNNGEFVFNVSGTDYARLTTAGEFITGGTTDQGAYNLQCNGTGVWGAGAYVNGSDARLKDDITTLNDGLNVVSQLRPVTFKYKPDYSKDQNVQTGFIAQELQAVLAGKDYVDGIVQAGPNHLNVAYQSLIPILVKAIQELTARVAELEAK